MSTSVSSEISKVRTSSSIEELRARLHYILKNIGFADSELDPNSERPIQNKAVYEALNALDFSSIIFFKGVESYGEDTTTSSSEEYDSDSVYYYENNGVFGVPTEIIDDGMISTTYYSNWLNRKEWSNDDFLPYDNKIYINKTDKSVYVYIDNELVNVGGIIDSQLDINSENAIQNKAVKQAIDNISSYVESNVNAITTIANNMTEEVNDMVKSVCGKKGVVVLNKTDVGLENVDNTADLAKTVKCAREDELGRTIVFTYLALANVKGKGNSSTPVYFNAAGEAKEVTAISAELVKTSNGDDIESLIAQLTDLESSNFIGILENKNDAANICFEKGYDVAWFLLGSDLSSLEAWRITNDGSTQLEQIGSIKYDFTDFTNTKQELLEKISEIGVKVQNTTPDLEITDETNNVLAKFEDGHFKTKNFDTKKTPLIDVVGNSDFEIADENGNAILQLSNGHVFTKKFDSSRMPVVDVSGDADFEVSDDKNNTIARFLSGHIQTKRFDSSKTPKITDNSDSDLDIVDDNGNILVRLANGHIYTKYFNSSNGVTSSGSSADLSNKQDKLISGVNIRTINGISLLGSGDISVKAGETTTTENNSKYYGKNIGALGDSITAGSNTTKTYLDYLVEYFGGKSYNKYNYGLGSSTVAGSGGTTKTFNERVSSVSPNVDLMFVFGGVNDHAFTLNSIGNVYTVSGSNLVANTDTNTFCGAYNYIVKTLMGKLASKNIYLLTPLHYVYYGDAIKSSLTKNRSGYYLKDYVEAIKEIGSFWGVPVIDLFSESMMNPNVEASRVAFFNHYKEGSTTVLDPLHPDANGHKRIFETIIRHL